MRAPPAPAFCSPTGKPWRPAPGGVLRDQSGQAAVFGALTLFILAASVIFVADMGMVTSTRIDMQNAADECAYGGALYEANVISSIGYLNEAMAYLYYDGIRYAADTTMLGVLASLKRWGPPYPSDTLVWEDQDTDPALYSGNPIDHYDRAYDRAREWIPQIEGTLNMFARWEWGMALASSELVKMEIHRTALKHGVEAVAVYPDFDFFPGNGVQFDLHILKLMNGDDHIGWRVWCDDPPFFVEARQLGPFHWLITNTDGRTYEIERLSETTTRVRTDEQDITVERLSDEHVRLTLIREEDGEITETHIDAQYLEGLGWAVAMSNDEYTISYEPMAGDGYKISVHDKETGETSSAGVRRGPSGRLQQWDGSEWHDVPGQHDSVTVGGVEIPVQVDNRIHIGPDTWFRVPNELHLQNITYLIPNVFQMPNIWVTMREDSVCIDAFIDINTPNGRRRLRFTIDENTPEELVLYGLMGIQYRVPDHNLCKWYASADGMERDRMCRDCQLLERHCDSPESEETQWTYQYRVGRPYFVEEDLRRFAHHAICDRDAYARSHDFEYPQWAQWYDIARGEPRGRDYYQTRPQWGAPANYDTDGDGRDDAVRIYASDKRGLNRTDSRASDPYFQRVKPWKLEDVADAATRFAPPVRLSEDFFYYALTVGCWRSARTSRTSTSRLNLFRNPSWGIIGAASARAGFLELVSDYPEDDTPQYRFTWPLAEDIQLFVNAGYENLYEPVWTAHLWPIDDAIRTQHLDIYEENQTGLSYLLRGLMNTYWYEPLTPDKLGDDPRRRDDVPGALRRMGVNFDHPRIGEVVEH